MKRLTLTILLLVLTSSCFPGGGTTQIAGPTQADESATSSAFTRTTVDALIFENSVFPTVMFRSATGAECDEAEHWHSDEPVLSIGNLHRAGSAFVFVCFTIIERANLRDDPSPQGCGHGKVSDVTRQTVQLFQDCLDAYRR